MPKAAPAVILIAGLQGSGKTTFSGKLANYLKKQKALAPAGCSRRVPPGSHGTVEVLGEQIGVDVYIEPENKNPVEIAQNAIRESRSKKQKCCHH